MASHIKKTAVLGAATLAAGAASLAIASPASAVTSTQITSQPHSVQRACAERILAAQGPGAWTAWSGSLDNMFAESGNNDKAINASSGAAGYYQIMPSTWADLCSDLGTSSGPTYIAPAHEEPALAQGSVDNYIADIQRAVNDITGEHRLDVDGVFGSDTQQQMHNVSVFFGVSYHDAGAVAIGLSALN